MKPDLAIVGLGPAGLDLLGEPARTLLGAAERTVILRTARHPAAAELAGLRSVITCDDLYERGATFDDVYDAVVERVSAAARSGPTTYAVPGSALVGERAVGELRRRFPDLVLHPGMSFLDLAFARAGLDPIADGFQLLDARDLPDPLLLHLPTVIAQIDTPLILHDVRERLGRLLTDDTEVTWLAELGSPEERVETIRLTDLGDRHAGLRTSLLVDVEPPGWPGLIRTNARLRRECPWDMRQTHHSLVKHLVEEAYEAVAAIEALPPEAPGGEADVAAYLEVEEELGDLLLQVVFHATLAAETDLFGIEEVAESIRRKLVRRHPHVFGDVDAPTADHVMANWETLKQEEKERSSLMDGVPAGLPALARSHKVQGRASQVGFDWPDLEGVVAKVREELEEVLEVIDQPERAAGELGDLLFSVVNLARRIDVDPEQALRGAAAKFERRFRVVEAGGDLEGLTLEEMDARWDAAKADEGDH